MLISLGQLPWKQALNMMHEDHYKYSFIFTALFLSVCVFLFLFFCFALLTSLSFIRLTEFHILKFLYGEKEEDSQKAPLLQNQL